jgi:ubiquinone biosynthesis protein
MISAVRFLRILQAARRHRLDRLLGEEGPWVLRAMLGAGGPESPEPRGARVRQFLEGLGPVFIKFGQLLSTRRDLLPPDIAEELAKLQDQVPPFASDVSQALIEKELGQPVAALFAEFSPTPLASASVAQVHAARLHSGEQVVVKVVRPGIERVIRQDLALLYRIASLLERFHPDGKRLRPHEVVADYEQVILDELDLRREAANAAQLQRNCEADGLVYVPRVFWDYTRSSVYVMERIHGIPVTDLAQLKARNVNMKVLAERGVEIFFKQVLRDSFFHADMHPGNIFVDASDPEQPTYIAIDCAIIGSLSEFDQYYLARNLLAIFQRDYREVARLHIQCGWVPPHTRAQDFEATIRSVCEPIFQKPISEISFGQLLVQLFQTARRYEMTVQPSLVLLQKTLLNVEGLGRQLYPELDLWQTAKPFLEQWMKERYAPLGVLRRLRRHLPGWLERMPEVPDALLDALYRIAPPPQPAQPKPAESSRDLVTSSGALLLAALGGAGLVLLWQSPTHALLSPSVVLSLLVGAGLGYLFCRRS